MIWVYCPCCHQHWNVQAAIGVWTNICQPCGQRADICYDHLTSCPVPPRSCAHRRYTLEPRPAAV